MTQDERRSRRDVLAAALGAAAGVAATGLATPLAADAATDVPLLLGQDNTATGPTRLAAPANHVVLGVATAGMPAFEDGAETLAVGTDVEAYPALNVVSTNLDMAIGLKVTAAGSVAMDGQGTATAIVAAGGGVGVRASQYYEFGAGVDGTAHGSQAAGVAGLADGDAGAGVHGVGNQGAAGGRFRADPGNALEVDGRTAFTRSGRASVPAGRSSVDITVPGGLSTTTSSVLATIQAYRPGVAVSCVRLNYPKAGKARIYLTKVASATHVTPVGWFVID